MFWSFETGFELFESFCNFDFASRPFHSFAPLKEKQFLLHVVRRNETRRLVSVFGVPGYWFLITYRTGIQDMREPHQLYTHISFSKFHLQSNH